MHAGRLWYVLRLWEMSNILVIGLVFSNEDWRERVQPSTPYFHPGLAQALTTSHRCDLW
jgi:hypothetical protein